MSNKHLELREKAVDIINKTNPDSAPPLEIDKERLIEELQVHQIELELQNDELRRVQNELTNIKDKYEDLYEFIPVGYFTLDKTKKILGVNLTGCSLLGYERMDLMGSFFFDFVDFDYQDIFYSHCEAVMRTSDRQACDLVLRRSNGELFHGLMESAVLSIATRNQLTIRTVIIDITKRKEAEQSLQQSHEELASLVSARTKELLSAKIVAEEANRAKTDFLGLISHELRNPMHQVLSYSKKGIKNTKNETNDKQAHYFKQVRTASERMLLLLNDLLDISKIESGTLDLYIEEHDLATVVKETISLLNPAIENSKLTLAFDYDTESTFNVACDKNRIGQVVRNLLQNAIHFSPKKGKILIRMTESMALTGTDYYKGIKVVISDSGIGFDEKELNSIFNKYYQGSKTGYKSSGIGLGLAISKEIIEVHNGKIWAENNKEGGATLVFQLPINQTDY